MKTHHENRHTHPLSLHIITVQIACVNRFCFFSQPSSRCIENKKYIKKECTRHNLHSSSPYRISATYIMAIISNVNLVGAVLTFSTLVMLSSGSAIPMWEFLSRGEKVSFSAFDCARFVVCRLYNYDFGNYMVYIATPALIRNTNSGWCKVRTSGAANAK